MESTSGTPHLLTDVRFSVSRKGYDPDEVDNFLERVSAAVAQLQDKLRQATAGAEAAEGRAADATRSQTLLQARVDKLEADLAAAREQAPAQAAAPARSPEEDAQEVSKVLVLAQRTADAAVAEARATASQLVNEAEQEASRILVAARTEADEQATRQRAALAEEVRTLEAARDQLAADIDTLGRYVDDQRAALSGALGRMQAVLDDPSVLRMAPAPSPSPVEIPAAATAVGSATASAAASVPAEASAVVTDVAPGAPTTAAEPEPEPPTSVVVADEAFEVPADDDIEVAAEEEHAPGEEPESLFSVNDPTEAPAHVGPPTAPIAVFDAEAEEAEEQFLGKDDDEADAAMRAFFEADFDDDQRFRN